MSRKERKSLFIKFLSDSLAFFDTALIIYEKLVSGKGPEFSDVRALEYQKIFNLARSFETLSKAYLVTYGTHIVYPALAIAAANRDKNVNLRYLNKIANSLRILLRQSLEPKKIKEKLGHDPVGKSEIPNLLRATSKLLNQLGEKRIAKLYELTSDYFSQINKTYAQLLQIRKETAIIVQFKEVYRQLLDIAGKCFQSEAEDDICKNLPKEIKIILSIYNNKPYLIDQILSMYDLGIQEMVDSMLYTAYLSRAAVIADYSVGREEKDEKYLEEIRDHQKEIIEFMRKIAQINKNLVRSTELDDYIDEIEDSNRSMYEQK